MQVCGYCTMQEQAMGRKSLRQMKFADEEKGLWSDVEVACLFLNRSFNLSMMGV